MRAIRIADTQLASNSGSINSQHPHHHQTRDGAKVPTAAATVAGIRANM